MVHLFDILWSKDPSAGHAALKELLAVSRDSDAVYPYMEQLMEKLNSGNSYFRTRALALIAANAKWDADCKIDENIDSILSHITDTKPVTARGLIQQLPALVRDKPNLRQTVLLALNQADTRPYPPSMRPLVDADIRKAILEIEKW